MQRLRAYTILLWRFVRYVLYRLGAGSCPTLRDLHAEMELVTGDLLRWHSRTRLVHPERCPRAGPAMFASNHFKRDDPFYLYHVVALASEGAVRPFPMMRDDFFEGVKHRIPLVDPDEMLRMAGIVQFNRDNPRLSQLRPVLEMLRQGESFLIYPGRSRSRSGLTFEYRDGITEPGSVSLFQRLARRGDDDPPVAAVPVSRTWNPVTDKSCFVFGEPLYLDPAAGKEAQRELDYRLVEAIAGNIEVSVPQVVCAVIYLHCLHGGGELPLERLQAMVRDVFDAIAPGRNVEPASREDLPGAVERTARYLAGKGIMKTDGETLSIDRDRVLGSPPLDSNYRKANPVKFIMNAVLHMTDLTSAAEDAVIRRL